MTSLSDTERRAWLRLARTQNVGPVTFAQLIGRFGSASAALKEVPRMVKRGGGDELRIPSEDDAARELAGLAKIGGRMIASCEAEFPHGLAAVEPPPPLLSVLGHVTLLQRETVAVVGARNASALGRKFANTMARDLSDAGLVVASGLARGIDAAAHEGALAGGTVAVVAGGVDVVYPPENAALHERLRTEGCIVSEMGLGVQPQARHFPRRNRIISGLSRGVVIVEASEGSGSLITANFALEQGREIFAVPGSPLDPRAKGTNRLIREGATLTESAEDVLAMLRPMLGGHFHDPGKGGPGGPANGAGAEAEADQIRGRVEEALGPAPVEVDELVRICGASPQAVMIILLEMELAGRITRHPGNRVSWA
ncbi:MAG: DNA-protecting protein DprA [Alphaproteobacteria bacterium]|nr:DNA-protecting protein DprA [Alphaproteobacteria bacterium]MBL6937791.1 DNA-protecting protein DprA [Alphaproteobacteria bacterium]MBL7099383.1 DNA-protecting protein DprA [Alphaproteobacteria bacterium]